MVRNAMRPYPRLYKARIGLGFTCNLRFDHLDEEMCRVLADGGCRLVTIGLENGNEEFRRRYLHRNMDNAYIIKAARWLREAGISVYTYNIIGLPYETLVLSLETVKLNARLRADSEIVSFFCPYPATVLRDISVAGGFLDPAAPLGSKVYLHLPDYPRRDIIYTRYSFHRLVRAYRRIYSLSDPVKASKLESALDRRILSPLLPRGLLGILRSISHHTVVGLKRLASSLIPSVYNKLRRLKYGTGKIPRV